MVDFGLLYQCRFQFISAIFAEKMIFLVNVFHISSGAHYANRHVAMN